MASAQAPQALKAALLSGGEKRDRDALMAYIQNRDWYIVRDGTVVDINQIGRGHVAVPIELFDALALMRYAQIVEECGPAAARANVMRKRMLKACDRFPTLGSEALRRMIGIPSLMKRP